MKRIIAIIVLVGILIFLFVDQNYGEVRSAESYTLSTDTEIDDAMIDQITLDVENVDVSIASADVEKIELERLTTNEKQDKIGYSTNFIDNELIIKQYNKKQTKKVDLSEDKIVLKIPSRANIDKVEFTARNSHLDINKISINELNVDVKKQLGVSISDAKIQKSIFRTDTIDANISNTELQKEITFDVGTGSIYNFNNKGQKEIVKNKRKLEYTNSNSFYTTTNFYNNNVTINFLLSKNKNYRFLGSGNKIVDSKIAENTFYKSYDYTGNNTGEIYTINLNNNDVKEIGYYETSK